jgi:hypothetical protein
LSGGGPERGPVAGARLDAPARLPTGMSRLDTLWGLTLRLAAEGSDRPARGGV